jgi:hypothetical protein
VVVATVEGGAMTKDLALLLRGSQCVRWSVLRRLVSRSRRCRVTRADYLSTEQFIAKLAAELGVAAEKAGLV